MTRLTDCSFIKRHENILITGSTGVGKSFISSALVNQACHKGFRVLYFNTQKLFTKLKMSKAEGTIADAILDRLVNGAHRIDLQGESLRKKK
jgi:DNA replication protein DnaC